MAKFFALLALFATVVVAQDAASSTASADAAVPSGLDDCIIGCVTDAATTAGCGTFTNASCVCTSQDFQTLAGACLQANCTADDLTTAQGASAALCAAAGSTNGSAVNSTGAPSGSAGSSQPPSPSSSGSAAGASHSSAAALAFSPQGVWGLAAAVVGLAVGL